MFSVVIPLYNKELSIRNTIRSVLDQTFPDFEILVVNDGSTDSSAAIVEEFDDPRIRLIHQKNQGVSAARNKGIEKANHEWVAFLDGDDIWKENHLSEVLRSMKLFPGEYVYVNSCFRIEDDHKIGERFLQGEIIKINDYFVRVYDNTLICTNGIVVKKSCFEKVGTFSSAISFGEDLDLWARLARKYSIIKNDTITSLYRLNAENRSNLSITVYTTIAYQIDLSLRYNKDEFKYYERLYHKRVAYFIAKRDFKSAYKLVKKQGENASSLNLLRYLVKKFFRFRWISHN